MQLLISNTLHRFLLMSVCLYVCMYVWMYACSQPMEIEANYKNVVVGHWLNTSRDMLAAAVHGL